MQDANSPTRRRWFQFTLRDCLIASLTVAATIAPLKLYERFNPPSQQVQLQATVYQADAALLRDHVRDLNEGQWRAVSKEEVAAVVAELQKINAKVLAAPKLMMQYGREASFMMGGQIPVVEQGSDGKELLTLAEFGNRLLVKPERLPNGRIQVDMEMQYSYQIPDNHPASRHMPANYIEGESDHTLKRPVIAMQKITFPAELASGETVFLCDASEGAYGRGTIIQVQVHKMK
jgi:hypothetical protein